MSVVQGRVGRKQSYSGHTAPISSSAACPPRSACRGRSLRVCLMAQGNVWGVTWWCWEVLGYLTWVQRSGCCFSARTGFSVVADSC